LLRARELLSDQFRISLTMTQVAAAAGVHPAHLAREFRRHFGGSVGQYVRRLRVDWSKTQLLTTTDSLARIAVRRVQRPGALHAVVQAADRRDAAALSLGARTRRRGDGLIRRPELRILLTSVAVD
jgi:hypothetical protein